MNPLSPPPSKQVLSVAARVASLDLARLFRQHDRDAVANRISEFRRARDQFLLGRVVIMAKQSSRARRARPAAAVWATACPRARSRETPNREFAPAPARSRAE